MRGSPALYFAGRISSFGISRAMIKLAAQWRACRSAAVAPLTALMLLPISGALAYAVELGSWQYMQRSAQNAADSAAIAAATVDSAGGKSGTTTSLLEATAAAAKFGFVAGTGSTTLTLEDTVANAATFSCPTGVPVGSTCYRATITTQFPLLFSRFIGFTGTGGGKQQIVSSSVAINKGGGVLKNICAGSLSPNGTSFQSNGGPKPQMDGCILYSNAGMTCNGHDLGALEGVAVGTSSGCGATQMSGAQPLDVSGYNSLASNIPTNTCGSYPQLAKSGGKYVFSNSAATTSNTISGSKAWTGNQVFCGDVQLGGNVTLTGSQTVVVIQNGRLDLNGYTLQTAAGTAATIVFSGTNDPTYSHYPTSLSGGGTLSINAPKDSSTSPWKNVAMYQDPNVTTNTSFTYTGNDPTWNIVGLVYLPKADVTFAGAVNKDASVAACFSLISYTILVNGTANILKNTACDSSGIVLPSAGGGAVIRERLVR